RTWLPQGTGLPLFEGGAEIRAARAPFTPQRRRRRRARGPLFRWRRQACDMSRLSVEVRSLAFQTRWLVELMRLELRVKRRVDCYDIAHFDHILDIRTPGEVELFLDR